VAINIPLLLERLPYRYPSFLLDAVIQHEPGRRLVAVKNVTVGEEFFQGHFPGTPLMPGVLMIEALAQTAAVLLFDRDSTAPSTRLYHSMAGRASSRQRTGVTVWKPSGIALFAFAMVFLPSQSVDPEHTTEYRPGQEEKKRGHVTISWRFVALRRLLQACERDSNAIVLPQGAIRQRKEDRGWRAATGSSRAGNSARHPEKGEWLPPDSARRAANAARHAPNAAAL
jgi:3-hydroxymyristoyl/3-hydroxydecanoyl-(acyl carrier protein) dehydratase